MSIQHYREGFPPSSHQITPNKHDGEGFAPRHVELSHRHDREGSPSLSRQITSNGRNREGSPSLSRQMTLNGRDGEGSPPRHVKLSHRHDGEPEKPSLSRRRTLNGHDEEGFPPSSCQMNHTDTTRKGNLPRRIKEDIRDKGGNPPCRVKTLPGGSQYNIIVQNNNVPCWGMGEAHPFPRHLPLLLPPPSCFSV